MSVDGFEIDFLPVGTESQSGDAIFFRYIENGVYRIILIDGGLSDTYATIHTHMDRYYGTTKIDHLVCSHPDQDHVGALEDILNNFNVDCFWINDPNNYIAKNQFPDEADDKIPFSKTHAGKVESLIRTAQSRGVAVQYPLQGSQIGPLHVCSPSKEFYREITSGNFTRLGGANSKFRSLARRVANWVAIKWNEDALYPYPATSLCNESSTVLFGSLMDNQYRILLTADAGIEALVRAFIYLRDIHGFQSGTLDFIQIPHHGGRHNVNSTVLDCILGNKTPINSNPGRGFAFASVAEGATEYPRRSVISGFHTRGYSCSATKSGTKRYPQGSMPARNWGTITPIPYTGDVEALDS